MKELLQDDYDSYLKCFDMPACNGLRINTLKTDSQYVTDSLPEHPEPVPWCPSGYTISGSATVTAHPLYHAGLYYLQEPSAMAPAEILPVSPGDTVLDVCSAPGGKATRLAEKLQGQGLLVSNDISFSRQKATLRNLERWGSRNHYVISEDPSVLKQRFRGFFDRILVDAPCSGEGMFRKDPSLIKAWLQHDDTYYPPLQKQILADSVEMLKEGGYLVYSTCTFSPLENEEIIQDILSRYPEMEITDIHGQFPYFRPGIGLPQTARLYPFALKGEGHFVALLHKKGSDSSEYKTIAESYTDEKLNEFLTLIDRNALPGCFRRVNDEVYLLPDIAIDVSRIKVLRSGLYCGTVKKNQFVPSQALAMALEPAQFAQRVHLDINDERVMKYLRGESFRCDTPYQGWVLVCLDDVPLGFVRGDRGLLKNRIDPGWRLT